MGRKSRRKSRGNGNAAKKEDLNTSCTGIDGVDLNANAKGNRNTSCTDMDGNADATNKGDVNTSCMGMDGNANASKKGDLNTSCTASNEAAGNELKQMEALFRQYAEKDSPDVIGPEQIEKLCIDLQVETNDVRLLMLSWKMGAAKQGYFTLEEWHNGLKAFKVDTIDKLTKVLPALEQEVMKPDSFQDFYTYSFRFCLTEDGQKFLDMESVCQLLELVLGKRNRPQVASLVEFLKSQQEYKAINLDQWQCFLRFIDEVNYPNFDNYDSSSAWPVILDNYVELAQEKK